MAVKELLEVIDDMIILEVISISDDYEVTLHDTLDVLNSKVKSVWISNNRTLVAEID